MFPALSCWVVINFMDSCLMLPSTAGLFLLFSHVNTQVPVPSSLMPLVPASFQRRGSTDLDSRMEICRRVLEFLLSVLSSHLDHLVLTPLPGSSSLFSHQILLPFTPLPRFHLQLRSFSFDSLGLSDSGNGISHS